MTTGLGKFCMTHSNTVGTCSCTITSFEDLIMLKLIFLTILIHSIICILLIPNQTVSVYIGLSVISNASIHLLLSKVSKDIKSKDKLY